MIIEHTLGRKKLIQGMQGKMKLGSKGSDYDDDEEMNLID